MSVICPIMHGDGKLGHGQPRAQETNLAISKTLLETPRPSTDHVLTYPALQMSTYFLD